MCERSVETPPVKNALLRGRPIFLNKSTIGQLAQTDTEIY
jgi:hypothetical protein